MISDEDEIVEQGSVFISTGLANNLRLFQFPAHSRSQPSTVKYKPVSKITRFEFEFDQENYDEEMAEELVGELSTERLDKLVLKSHVVPIQAKYFVGIMDSKNDLHLTELSGIHQMRPDLSYIDKRIEMEKESKARMNYEELKELIPNYDEDAKAIQVSVRAANDEEGARKANAAELRMKVQNEEFIELKVHLAGSEKSQEYMERMLCDVDEDIPIPIVNNESILEKIVQAPDVDIVGRNFDSNSSFLQTGHLILGDRLTLLFLNAHCIRFSTVQELFSEFTEQDLTFALSKLAVCINGIWIIKSDYLYSGTVKNSRDYLLYLFNQKQKVSRERFCQVTHLNEYMSSNLFSEIGEKVGNYWILKDEQDLEYCQRNQDLIKTQSEDIIKTGKELRARFEQLKISTEHSTLDINQQTKQMSALSTLSDPNIEFFEIVGETSHEQLFNVIVRLLTSNGATRMERLLKMFQSQQSNRIIKLILAAVENLLPKCTSQDIASALESLTITVNNDLVALKSLSNSAIDTYRNAIIKLFNQKIQIKKAEAMAFWDSEIGSKPSNPVYTKIMQEFATSRAGGNWTLK